jgi:hypothetical protein
VLFGWARLKPHPSVCSSHVTEVRPAACSAARPVQCTDFVRPFRVSLATGTLATVPGLGADFSLAVGLIDAEIALEPVELVGIRIDRVLVVLRSEDQQHHFAARREAGSDEMKGLAGAQIAPAAVTDDFKYHMSALARTLTSVAAAASQHAKRSQQENSFTKQRRLLDARR